MANPQDLEKLCQGPKVWNAWRAENSERVPDLRGARLTLGQRQFGVNHGGPVDLNRCDLESAEFRHANLVGADLQYARLVAADLVHAQLDNADLSGADLTDAVLDYADLTDAELDGAIVIGASFANAKGLTQEQLAVAHGDASTVLPAMLMPPSHWYPPLDDDMFGGSPAPDSIEQSDPYEVLRVSQTASQDEIRASFRNLVKLYHPDVNPGDAEAQEIFKSLSIAYRIVGDPEKRARYDRGEIGGDGEVSAEYEAKQHFRRHAFRIYAAAAASLFVAVGALVAVWYVVLTNDVVDDRRVRIAVSGPPKQDERLPAPSPYLTSENTERLNVGGLDEDAQALLNAKDEPVEEEKPEPKTAESASPDPVADAPAEKTAEVAATGQAESEVASGEASKPEPAATAADTGAPHAVPQTQDQRAAPPVQDRKVARLEEAPEPAAETPAQQPPAAEISSPGAPPGQDVVPASPPPSAADGGQTPPLGEQHSVTEARPAQADAARSVTPDEAAGGKTGSLPAGVASRSIVAKAGPGYSPHSALLRDTKGRRVGTDPVAALLFTIVIETKAAPKRDQTTGSIGPLLARGSVGDGEEVFDVYGHSLPEPAADHDRGWQGLLRTGDRSVERKTRAPKRTAVSVPAEMKAGNSAPPEPSPGAAFRERAVSDILAGGL